MGSAGAARDGSTSSKRDIEKALRFWARCVTKVLGPLLGCPTGAEEDYGIGIFFQEAEHVDAARLLRACEETFCVMARQFQQFRTSFDAPQPDPLRAFSDAIADAIRPLAHEQNTQAIAQALVNSKLNAPGKPGKPGKRRPEEEDSETDGGMDSCSNPATTRTACGTRAPTHLLVPRLSGTAAYADADATHTCSRRCQGVTPLVRTPMPRNLLAPRLNGSPIIHADADAA